MKAEQRAEKCTSSDFAVMKFRFMAKLTMFNMCAWSAYFFCVTFFPIPKENLPIVNTILGFLILELGIMIGYYFGASQSSNAMKAKDREFPDPEQLAEEARIKEQEEGLKKLNQGQPLLGS